MKQFLTILLLCCASFAQTKSTTAAKSTTPAKKAAPARNLLDPSTLRAIAPPVYKAKFATTQGDFIVQVTRAWAPLGADRFYNLVRGRFFDGCAFFRVIPGFMAQFGISPDPKISAVWQKQNLRDDPVKEKNVRGFLTFATAGPNTRTTQLFINYADNSANLDPQGFAPFGEVIEGMEFVDKFYSGYGGNPDQTAIQQMGKPWILKNMPKVDSIKTAIIIPLTPAPAKSATTAKAPAAKATTKQ